MASYGEDKAALEKLWRQLWDLNPSAVRSLEEGMEKTLTLYRMGVGVLPRRTLSTPNAIESCLSNVRHVTRNVKRWQGGDHIARWTAMGLMEVEKKPPCEEPPRNRGAGEETEPAVACAGAGGVTCKRVGAATFNLLWELLRRKRLGMEKIFESLTSDTLRKRIGDKIRQAIIDGSLKEGERLIERRLATVFATSLTAVREALIQLESEGFVTKKPNAATHVAKVSLDGMEKIYAVRKVLERYAVEEAARRASDEQIGDLEKKYQTLFESASRGNYKESIMNDLSLHEAIWKITGNEYLQAALRRVVVPVFSFTAIRWASSPQFDLLRDASAHVQFLEFLKLRDPDAAGKAFLAALDEWSALARSYFVEASEGMTSSSSDLSRVGAKGG